jgi:hypothetical protein
MNASPRRRRRGSPYNPAHDRRATESNKGVQNHLLPREVDDPYEAGGKIIVMRSTRDDPLAKLHGRNQIDEAQYQGGRAFQSDFEAAERGPRAIDPGKEYVDGGMAPEPITEAQRKAARNLAGVNRELGQNGSALVYAVLISRVTVEQICDGRGLKTERERLYVGRRFRECLDDLAKFYGFVMEAGR